MLLQSMAIVVKKLLVDDKKSAFAKQIQGVTCKVLNRKAWAYGRVGIRNPELEPETETPEPEPEPELKLRQH